VQSTEIRGVVCYEDKVILLGMACNVPILLAGHVEVNDVVRFVAVVDRNGD
jgi:hypothetical protein